MIEHRRRRISQSAAGLFVAFDNRDRNRGSTFRDASRTALRILLTAAPSLAIAQMVLSMQGGLTEARDLTDNRIEVVKNVQLTSEQMKY